MFSDVDVINAVVDVDVNVVSIVDDIVGVLIVDIVGVTGDVDVVDMLNW